MRILIFGDVHGNLIALEKLFEIEKNNFDRFICHGDIVNYGPWSNECTQFLIDKKEGILLLGNHEEYFINGNYPGENLIAKSFFEFCYRKYDQSLISALQKFGLHYVTGNFHIRHSVDGLYIFQDTDIDFSNFADNTIIGHSHQQFHRIIDGKNLFNTGSIGQNRAYLNVSNYIVIDTETDRVNLKSFKHDISAVIAEMEKLDYPEICMNYYKGKAILK